MPKYDIILDTWSGNEWKCGEVEAESRGKAMERFLKLRTPLMNLKWMPHEIDEGEWELMVRTMHGEKIWQEGEERAWFPNLKFWYVVREGTDTPIEPPKPLFTPEQCDYVNKLVGREVIKPL